MSERKAKRKFPAPTMFSVFAEFFFIAMQVFFVRFEVEVLFFAPGTEVGPFELRWPGGVTGFVLEIALICVFVAPTVDTALHVFPPEKEYGYPGNVLPRNWPAILVLGFLALLVVMHPLVAYVVYR